MFSRAFKFLRRVSTLPILAASLLTLNYGVKKIHFNQIIKDQELDASIQNSLKRQKQLRKLIQKQVCQSKDIRQGQLFFVQVTQQREDDNNNKTYTIALGRVKGKLYAVIGHCPYKQPLSEDDIHSNILTDAIIFNNKLCCPHHGCVFDISSGSVQFGPARQNLSRFFVQQRGDKVYISHPSVIPISVTPKYQLRDLNDLRKVVIIGGDHHATMGVIDGLKQYDYGGQISIIMPDGDGNYPYRQDLLHRKLINLRKNGQKTVLRQQDIKKQLQQKLYSKLYFTDQLWYLGYGIDFIFNSEMFKVINKRFFPYVKFLQGTKVQFDGIVYATGFMPRLTFIKGITGFNDKQFQQQNPILPHNVFVPFYNKHQHQRMLKFLNKYKVNNLMVMGMSVQSLQFIEALDKQFPDIKVKVIDLNKQNTLTQLFGPDIGDQIISQYTKRGVQFFIKLQKSPTFINQVPLQNQKDESMKDQLKISNSVKVQLDQKYQLAADCVVMFPNNTYGNSKFIKNAKHVDLDYKKNNERIIVDTTCRTDTKRMFAAGTGSSMQYFFTKDKIQLINPNVSYQQGMTVGFNLNALKVPFHYIPIEMHKFYDKKILYAGARKQFDSMYILGDVKKWDFIAFYSKQQDIIAVSATPSRQKQFQVIRQAFRLECQPNLKSIIQGKWTIPLIYKLIRKLDKSGCYKDLVHTLHPEQNIPDVIWMDRQSGSFVNNSNDDDDENKTIQFDSRGYATQN